MITYNLHSIRFSYVIPRPRILHSLRHYLPVTSDCKNILYDVENENVIQSSIRYLLSRLKVLVANWYSYCSSLQSLTYKINFYQWDDWIVPMFLVDNKLTWRAVWLFCLIASFVAMKKCIWRVVLAIQRWNWAKYFSMNECLMKLDDLCHSLVNFYFRKIID